MISFLFSLAMLFVSGYFLNHTTFGLAGHLFWGFLFLAYLVGLLIGLDFLFKGRKSNG